MSSRSISNGSRGFLGRDILGGEWKSWKSDATVRLVNVCDRGATPFQTGNLCSAESDVALFGRDKVTSQRQTCLQRLMQ